MSDDFTPFTLLEAEVALYLVDADDNPTSEVFIGGCPEKLTCDGEFSEKRLEYPGLPFGRVYHADETHTVVLENLRLLDQSVGAPRMPALHRNRRYHLVIVWQDEETLCWNKRVYTGVTAQPNRVEESSQTLRFKAEQLFEFAGLGMAPAATPSIPGVVRYVDGLAVTDLYYFDFEGRSYSALLTEGLAELDFSVAGICTVTIGGAIALVASAGGLHIASLVATGGTFVDESPRLEWWRGGVRLASLGQSGTLAVANVTEQLAAPALATDFETVNPGWLFSFAPGRAYAPAFAETL